MKRYIRSALSLCLVLLLAVTALPLHANAAINPFFVVSYNPTQSSIEKDDSVSIDVTLMRTDGESGDIIVVRNVDDFRAGTESVSVKCEGDKYIVPISGLRYRGEGNTLSFTVNYDGQYQNMSVKIAECVPYVEESDPTPEAAPAPKLVISARSLQKPIAANESAVVSVEVSNVSSTDVKSAMVTFTPSDSLMLLGAQNTFYIGEIRAGKSASISLTVTAMKKISSQDQSIGATVSFDYDNNITTASGTASGRISVPAETGGDSGDVANPVPLVILSGYSYGGASVAAGSEADLTFTFLNTSRTTAIENVMLTVACGTDLMLSGSTNTFYFDTVSAGGSRTVSVPLKASQRISASTQDVTLAFSYEYVDREQRMSNQSNLSISVPLYQPDRFEIAAPTVPYTGYAGEEISLTLDYVNKGKSEVSNVEAEISGDVDAYNPYQRVGNIESGKSGTIAFAVTPQLEGDNQVTVKITYEDANGEVKERVFETTVTTMAYEEFDPGEWDEPVEPMEPEHTFPWWIVGAAAAVVTIVVGIVVSKKKKKAKLQAEQDLWDDWEDDEPADKPAEQAKPQDAAEEAKK